MSGVIDDWDTWFGQLTLKGLDPRRWDLRQMLAAYEVSIREGCEDEAEWNRVKARLYAEPKEIRDARRKAARTGANANQASSSGVGMDAGRMAALIAAAQAGDSGAGAAW